MAEKQGGDAKPEKKKSILKSAAEALGSAAGTIASVVKPGSGEHAQETRSTKSTKPGRLGKSAKSRLPRKEKKAQKKAAAKTASIPSPS